MSDSESPGLGTRLLFAVIGAVVGGVGGIFAADYVTAVEGPMLIGGGAVAGLVVGFIAPRLMEVIATMT